VNKDPVEQSGTDDLGNEKPAQGQRVPASHTEGVLIANELPDD